MKVAVSTWEGRISPVFDTAREVVCYRVENGESHSADGAAFTSDDWGARLETLRGLGVKVLICGAVSRPLAEAVNSAGIRLVPFVAGETEEIVAAFAAGRFREACFHMPGCCGRECRRRRGGRGGRRWEVQR